MKGEPGAAAVQGRSGSSTGPHRRTTSPHGLPFIIIHHSSGPPAASRSGRPANIGATSSVAARTARPSCVLLALRSSSVLRPSVRLRTSPRRQPPAFERERAALARPTRATRVLVRADGNLAGPGRPRGPRTGRSGRSGGPPGSRRAQGTRPRGSRAPTRAAAVRGAVALGRRTSSPTQRIGHHDSIGGPAPLRGGGAGGGGRSRFFKIGYDGRVAVHSTVRGEGRGAHALEAGRDHAPRSVWSQSQRPWPSPTRSSCVTMSAMDLIESSWSSRNSDSTKSHSCVSPACSATSCTFSSCW